MQNLNLDKKLNLTSIPKIFGPEVDGASEVEGSLSRALTWYHHEPTT